MTYLCLISHCPHTITIKLHHVKIMQYNTDFNGSRDVYLCEVTRRHIFFSCGYSLQENRVIFFQHSFKWLCIQQYKLDHFCLPYIFRIISENEETCDSLTQRSVVGANVIAGGELRCKGGFPYPRCTQHADFVSGHSFVTRVLLCLYPWKLWRRAEKQKSFQTCGWLVSIWEKQGSSPDIFLVSYRHSYFYNALLLFSFPCKMGSEMGLYVWGEVGILILLAIFSIGILKIGWVIVEIWI